MPLSERTLQDPHERIARPILSWLAHAPAENPADDVEALRHHLDQLRYGALAPAQKQKLLGLLQPRASVIVETLLPRLYSARLPISPRTRQMARSLQECLDNTAALYLEETGDSGGRLIKGLQRPLELSLWHSLMAAGRRLLLANLIAAPHPHGAWTQLHAAYAAAREQGLQQRVPEGAPCSIEHAYLRSLLLGCVSSSAFTALEWSLIEHIGRHLAPLLVLGDTPSVVEQAQFWFAPAQDMPPVPHSRRAAPDEGGYRYLSAYAFCQLLAADLPVLRNSRRPESGTVPDSFPARHAYGVIQRLLDNLLQTRKRRFPRRRQSYRASACFGFDAIWQQLRQPADVAEHGVWQITNESPDGYAAMHVAGRTQKVQIGDLTALRPARNPDWQLCVVRWALSENPEHLELGLQILAPRAIPAFLALPGQGEISKHPVFLLPPVPPLRAKTALAMPGGLRLDPNMKLVLIIEDTNLEVREVRLAENQEHAAGLDVFLIDDVVVG